MSRGRGTSGRSVPPAEKVDTPKANATPSYWGPALSVVLALLTLGGVWYSTKGAFDAKMVELGIGILSADPSKTEVSPARQWALELVEEHSGKKFSEVDRESLLNHPIAPQTVFYVDPRTPGGIAAAGCKAWRKNPDGSWTQVGKIVLPGNNTVEGMTMRNTGETRLLDQICK